MKHEKVEYRVRPVTRYIITRHHQYDDTNGQCGASNEVYGEFDNLRFANRMVTAMANSESLDVQTYCHTLDEEDERRIATSPIEGTDPNSQ